MDIYFSHRIDNIASFKEDEKVENTENKINNKKANTNDNSIKTNTNSHNELWLEVGSEDSGVYSCEVSNRVSRIASNYNFVLAITNDVGSISHMDNYEGDRAQTIGWSDNREKYRHRYMYTEEGEI